MAIIDIGSNSVRILLGGVKTTTITRVSQGLSKTGLLSESGMARTLDTLTRYVNMARSAGEEIYAFGTEPFRVAKNAHSFLDEVKTKLGLDIQVVSGDEEAELAFLGAVNGSGSVIDIGGASVEIVSGTNGTITYKKSLPIGIVKLTEIYGTDFDKLELDLVDIVKGYDKFAVEKIYGIAGTITSLGGIALGLETYKDELVHDAFISKAKLQEIITQLKPLKNNTEKITKLYPILPPLRADVITAGAILLHALLNYYEVEGVVVSTRDNLEGWLLRS